MSNSCKDITEQIRDLVVDGAFRNSESNDLGNVFIFGVLIDSNTQPNRRVHEVSFLRMFCWTSMYE